MVPPAGSTTPQSLPATQVQLLGGFRLTVGGAPVPEAAWRVQKAKGLIKLLALAPGHRLARDQLLDLLWPDFAPEAAANNLHRTLAAARRALGPAVPLRLRGGVLALDPAGPLEIDVVAFEAAAAHARRSPDPAALEAALALYGGELLPEDRYEDWAAGRRETLREAYRDLLAAAAELHEASGDQAAAIAALRRLVADDPTREPAHVALMRAYALSGQRSRAALQFRELQDALAREMDAEPEQATRRLHAAILTGHYPPPATPPTAATSDSPAPLAPPVAAVPVPEAPAPAAAAAHALPVALTSFVGRARELAELRALLAAAPRLVTLTGPGGGGKTRLALALAAELAAGPGELRFAELAPLADPALVAPAVAAAFDVRELPGQPPSATLVATLRERPALLLLDNCEHLIDAAAELLSTLLAGCPGLRVLATSREALRLPGEVVWRVPPLGLPAPLEPEELDAPAALAALGAVPAVGLFLDRARGRQPGFALTPANARSVIEICRRLDGHPLALELAAARIGTLAVEQLAARLDDALATLASRERAIPARQQTLRATLDWSHGLLTPDERALLRRLAPFAGGFDLDAGEAVAGDDQAAPGGEATGTGRPALPTSRVLETLEGLVDKSLVQAEAEGAEARYRLLEPVRQYAWERLRDAGEEEAARDRHAAHYLALTRAAEPALVGPQAGGWLERLEREADNLRAALDRLRERGAAGEGLLLCWQLWRYWATRGHLLEGRRWLAAFLDLVGPDGAGVVSPLLHTRTLFAAARLAYEQGDNRPGEALAARSLAVARAHADGVGVAAGLTLLGHFRHRRGDYVGAGAMHAEALALRRAARDERGVGLSLLGMGRTALGLGDHAAARAYLNETLDLLGATGDRETVVQVRILLGQAAREEGDDAAARSHFEVALAEGRELGARLAVARALVDLAGLATNRGELVAARALLIEALALIRALGARQGMSHWLEAFAHLAAAAGDAARAVRLAAAAAAYSAAIGMAPQAGWLARVARELAPARAALGEAACATQHAAGAALPLEALALPVD